MTFYLEEFDIARLVDEVGATVQPLIGKNANRLEIECPRDIGSMRADVTKVRQTLYNLLSNASKFTERGVISLRVVRSTPSAGATELEGAGASAGGVVTFSVSDTGIGMSPEQLQRIFEAFLQADASTTRKFGGTGLGLSISRQFCRMMGGDIQVSSVPGRGSTFTVVLPAIVAEPVSAAGQKVGSP